MRYAHPLTGFARREPRQWGGAPGAPEDKDKLWNANKQYA